MVEDSIAEPNVIEELFGLLVERRTRGETLDSSGIGSSAVDVLDFVREREHKPWLEQR